MSQTVMLVLGDIAPEQLELLHTHALKGGVELDFFHVTPELAQKYNILRLNADYMYDFHDEALDDQWLWNRDFRSVIEKAFGLDLDDIYGCVISSLHKYDEFESTECSCLQHTYKMCVNARICADLCGYVNIEFELQFHVATVHFVNTPGGYRIGFHGAMPQLEGIWA